MKRRKSLVLLVIIAIVFVFNLNSYAVTLPWLEISSNNYPVGRISEAEEEKDKIEVGQTLQLYAHIYEGHDVYDPSQPDGGLGRYVVSSNLSDIEWTSSDTSVATIDTQGKVTGLKEGTTTITATNTGTTNFESEGSATKEIQVIKSTDKNNYYFGPVQSIGPNNSMVKKGQSVNEILQLYNITTNSFEDIDDSKVTVEVSDNSLVSINNNTITAKEEGQISVTYKYTFENMNFEYVGKYYIYDEEFEGTKAPIIEKASVKLNGEEDSKILNVAVAPLGSAGLYNDNFRYDWSVEDGSIASIEKNTVDGNSIWESSVKVKGLKNGNTIVKCKITREATGEIITKKIAVTVSGIEEAQNQQQKETPSNSSTNQTPKDTSVSSKEIPKAGLINGGFVTVLTISIIGVVFYIKYKKIDK